MGNVECQRCCAEEKKNEVDVHAPSYPTSSSFVRTQGALSTTSPRDEADQPPTTPTAASTEPGQWAANSSSFLEPPESREPTREDTKTSEQRTGVTSPRQTSPRPPNSGRTAAEWAQDQEQFAHLPPLPEGWIRVKSRSSGQIYYCCKETGETTFVEPTATQAVTKSDDLPPGWLQMTSRSTGRVYFWNSALQKSQFDKPTAAAPVSAQPQEGPDNEGLPEGWTSMVSRSNGRTYYYNAKLQKSQYDRPTA